MQSWAKVALLTLASATMFLMLFVVRLAQSDRPSGVQLIAERAALVASVTTLLLSWLLYRRARKPAARRTDAEGG